MKYSELKLTYEPPSALGADDVICLYETQQYKLGIVVDNFKEEDDPARVVYDEYSFLLEGWSGMTQQVFHHLAWNYIVVQCGKRLPIAPPGAEAGDEEHGQVIRFAYCELYVDPADAPVHMSVAGQAGAGTLHAAENSNESEG